MKRSESVNRLAIAVQRHCDDMLKYGEVLEDREYVEKGMFCRDFTIRYEGDRFAMKKRNGLWVSVRKCGVEEV